MPLDEEAITQQRALLTQNRRRLAVLLQQQARLGDYVPPHVPLEIEDIQTTIRAVKERLRADDVQIEDEPNDDAVAAAVAGSSRLSSQEQRNRSRMLDKVEAFWIKGVLENSLHSAALIELGLEYKPNAVQHPWGMIVQQPNKPSQPIASGTKIINVFDALGGELLILGAPGSGKTTMLLELARDLIARAEQDKSYPMPVVFNLSSWAEKRKPLVEWLLDELNTKYDIPRRIGKAWVETDQVLPLLDGLDEAKQEHRGECVDAINRYRQEHGLVSVVVCCRVADYDVLAAQLKLQGAVLVQPLTQEQIDAYLATAGDQFVTLRTMLREDNALRELVQAPLMLSILALAYHDLPQDVRIAHQSDEAHRQQLFTAYVAHMFARRQAARYPSDQMIRWLGWLACALRDHAQTVFSLEQLQPDWLPSNQRSTYARDVGLIAGLIYGGAIMVAYAVPYGLATGLVAGVIDALIVGLVISLVLGIPAIQQQLHQGGWRAIRISLALGLGIAALVGSVIGLISSVQLAAIVAWQQHFPFVSSHWLVGLLAGLFIGLLTGVAMGIVMVVIAHPEQITGVETMHWSWSQLRYGDWRRILPLFVGGLAVALTIGVVLLLAGARQYGIATTITLLLMNIAGLIIIKGSSTGVIETKTIPNQGIRRSVRHALVIGGMSGLLFGLSIGTIDWMLGADVRTSVALGISYLCGFAVFIAPLYGGLASIQHAVLRWLLWRGGMAPLRYAAFLDDCVARIFLHRVGGGWIFVHRLLMEYFATQGTE